ncbi:MAG: prephenate dehydrogenase/arogenate dehydrogenase family protein [Candidatus Peregrinibacteria bacterium]
MKLHPSTTTIGIIGGVGRTGGQFRHLFENQGFRVLTTGKNTQHRNPELIAKCDVVLFSVPLSQTLPIMRSLITKAKRADQLILDVSSLKGPQMKILTKAKGEVIGMHPLFAPTTDPQGETIILCPGAHKKETLLSLTAILKAMGLKTIIMTPEEHDRTMGFIQVLPHLKSLLMASVLEKLGANIDVLEKLCTPAYEIELNVIGRFLDDSPDLYGPIILSNPEVKRIIRTMKTLLEEYDGMAKKGDLKAFTKHYESLRRSFGSFPKHARRRSEACIRTLASLR